MLCLADNGSLEGKQQVGIKVTQEAVNTNMVYEGQKQQVWEMADP